MLTPQNSELYLAALLHEAGLDQGEALRVAGSAHDLGLGRTSGQRRAVLENAVKSIREKAAANVEAIARVIADHYSDVSAVAQESVDDMSMLDFRRELKN